MRLSILLPGLLLGSPLLAQAQQVIPLYPGKAPGSETWNWPEREQPASATDARAVYNVTTPTLTAYLPAPGRATGTAVIVCPGGAFHALAIDVEGTLVARRLQAQGIAAFVLKYRLVHVTASSVAAQVGPLLASKNYHQLDSVSAPVVPLAIADGKRAVEYVRGHAREYRVQPNRIGLMGFSAGGTVTMGVGYTYSAANRPDFLASLYLYLRAVPKRPVPVDAPPLFAAAASDDELGLAPNSVQLYSDWLAAGKSAELHMYVKGGHGFGMKTQHIPTDTWFDRFTDWLAQQGFAPVPSRPAATGKP